jgi:hypothetical protein
VARVADGVPLAAAYQRVAWLHDVLEDSDVTAADLRGRLPDGELGALVLLTHSDPAEPYADYVGRIVDAPEHSQSTAAAISSGVPMRPIGAWAIAASRRPGVLPVNPCTSRCRCLLRQLELMDG